MFYIDNYLSPIGDMLIITNQNSLLGLYWKEAKYAPEIDLNSCPIEENSISRLTKLWLDKYFCGQIPNISIPLHLGTSRFRQLVLEQLNAIPYGETTTYKNIANKISIIENHPIAYQAIGSAVSHNPISIIIPCHRAIGTNNKLIGYNGGLERKKYLLNLEKQSNIAYNEKTKNNDICT